jgi:hypothetical protein
MSSCAAPATATNSVMNSMMIRIAGGIGHSPFLLQ